jgi:hypothetical protein
MLTLLRLAPFRNAYLLRGIVLWVGVRMALALSGASDPGVAAELTTLGLVAIAVVLDARRRSEDLFLGNLGVPTWAIAVMALPAAVVLECLVP